MECDICSRTDLDKIGVHCPVCARTAVYPLRLDAARTLLEKENLEGRIEQTISDVAFDKSTAEIKSLARAWNLESTRSRTLSLKEDLEVKESSRQNLKGENDLIRNEIKERRTGTKQRRIEIDLLKQHIPNRQHTLLDKLNQIGQRGVKSFDSIHDRSVHTRAFLCREAATLLRFRSHRVQKDNRNRQFFSIASHTIPNLRYIHQYKCEELTAVLADVSRLLVLIVFYIGIRLPAEITLPHRDYPLTTISAPSASYSGSKVPFPGSGSGVSLSTSPSSSKYEAMSLSKPRPLFIGQHRETLAEAAKQDPTAYNYFLEALSLLAWDIMWLKHSQGIANGTESWDAACDIGRNLWQLVFQSQDPPRIPKNSSERENEYPAKHESAESSGKTLSREPFVGTLGGQSHDSAHTFLGYAMDKDQLKPMKLSKHTMIFDPLRKALEIEFKNAEWDLLDRAEADDGEERFDTNDKRGNAVVVRDVHLDGAQFDESRKLAGDRQPVETTRNAPNGVRTKGTSGWTKIRNREEAS